MLPLASSLKTTRRAKCEKQSEVPSSPFKCLKSLNSNTGVIVTFINDFKNKIVNIYWINYEGNLVLYSKLSPGTSFRIFSYVTHPWVFFTEKGVVLGYYLPTNASDQIYYIKNGKCSSGKKN